MSREIKLRKVCDNAMSNFDVIIAKLVEIADSGYCLGFYLIISNLSIFVTMNVSDITMAN